MVDVSDVTSDMQQHIRVIGNSVTSLGNRRLQGMCPFDKLYLYCYIAVVPLVNFAQEEFIN